MRNELPSLSARTLARRLARREVSAEEVMRAHLDRIRALNPELNAIVTLLPEPDLLAAARAKDDSLRRGDVSGPLHGLPVAHKDLHLTRGIRTTFGSPIFADFVPREEALIVARIRRAGAIAIGKTNTPEFGAGSQTFNPVFGATRNPWDPTRTCGGSSGGAAVALATGMVPLAEGSDYGGSLRNPASFCGVVGLRPSPGRVPDWPDEAPWFPVPVSGPMARSAADAALLLGAIAGPDARAPLSLPDPGAAFHEPLDRDFHGTRVAWSAGFAGLPFDRRVVRAVAPARAALESIGCEVADEDPDMAGATGVFDRLRAWYFDLCYGPLLERHRARMKETVIWNIERGQALTASDLAGATRRWTALLARATAFMARFEFFVLPTVQAPPFDLGQEYLEAIEGVRMRTYTEWMGSCALVSLLGLPAASVPVGMTDDGLPVGLQVVGRARADFAVLQLAHALEAALPPPSRLPFPIPPGPAGQSAPLGSASSQERAVRRGTQREEVPR